MANLHRKMRNVTERYLRIGECQARKIEPANLELSAMSCRNGRILTVKCQTTADYSKSEHRYTPRTLEAHTSGQCFPAMMVMGSQSGFASLYVVTNRASGASCVLFTAREPKDREG
jgi:hypothetical protein